MNQLFAFLGTKICQCSDNLESCELISHVLQVFIIGSPLKLSEATEVD
jgi:hypothetical protein